jgi:hypothetical protein
MSHSNKQNPSLSQGQFQPDESAPIPEDKVFTPSVDNHQDIALLISLRDDFERLCEEKREEAMALNQEERKAFLKRHLNELSRRWTVQTIEKLKSFIYYLNESIDRHGTSSWLRNPDKSAAERAYLKAFLDAASAKLTELGG